MTWRLSPIITWRLSPVITWRFSPFLNIVQPWEVHLVKKAQNQSSLRLWRQKLQIFFKEWRPSPPIQDPKAITEFIASIYEIVSMILSNSHETARSCKNTCTYVCIHLLPCLPTLSEVEFLLGLTDGIGGIVSGVRTAIPRILHHRHTVTSAREILLIKLRFAVTLHEVKSSPWILLLFSKKTRFKRSEDLEQKITTLESFICVILVYLLLYFIMSK